MPHPATLKKTKLSTRIKKRMMVDALQASLGVVSIAAKAVPIDRTKHYDWLKEDPEYKAKVDAIEDIALDFVESKLHKQIENGDTTAAIFYLKTKGKKRGYIENPNIINNNNLNADITLGYGKEED